MTQPNQCERELARYVMKYYNLKKEDVVFNDRTQIYPYELDLWIPKLRLGIEFQGPTHYHVSRFSSRKLVDKTKRTACQSRGISLVCIPFWKLNEGAVLSLLSWKHPRHLHFETDGYNRYMLSKTPIRELLRNHK